MKIVNLNNLPIGTQVRGILYDDPNYDYGLGDVLEVELPSGRIIDVGWDKAFPDEPFRVVVYREYFGDRSVDFRVRDAQDVAARVEALAAIHSEPIVAATSSTTQRVVLSSSPANSVVRIAECLAASVFAAMHSIG